MARCPKCNHKFIPNAVTVPRSEILKVMKANGSSMNLDDIIKSLHSQGTDINSCTIRYHLRNMTEDEDIKKIKRGRYIVNNSNANEINETTKPDQPANQETPHATNTSDIINALEELKKILTNSNMSNIITRIKEIKMEWKTIEVGTNGSLKAFPHISFTLYPPEL